MANVTKILELSHNVHPICPVTWSLMVVFSGWERGIEVWNDISFWLRRHLIRFRQCWWCHRHRHWKLSGMVTISFASVVIMTLFFLGMWSQTKCKVPFDTFVWPRYLCFFLSYLCSLVSMVAFPTIFLLAGIFQQPIRIFEIDGNWRYQGEKKATTWKSIKVSIRN